jgi:hypothetical protein
MIRDSVSEGFTVYPGNRSARTQAERRKPFTYSETIGRDKANLDTCGSKMTLSKTSTISLRPTYSLERSLKNSLLLSSSSKQ